MPIGDQYDGGIGRAVHLMQFYMSSLAESAGWKWNADNDAEVQDMVECIVSAATPEQPKLYIWKVERTDRYSYDDYTAFVCTASTEAEAMNVQPSDYGWGSSGVPSGLKVTKLGVATKGLAAGAVLLASFRAG
jgi:hypothetical protein